MKIKESYHLGCFPSPLISSSSKKNNLITIFYRHYILCVDYKNQSFTLRYLLDMKELRPYITFEI
ncbi:TPA: hypothetical protein JI076_17235 [Acinetobacter baumannii]|nr:hypothetical protein [Acinetobacter baumannii]